MPNTATISYIDINGVQHPIDAVTVGGRTLDNLTGLPVVSNSDNGKVLRVVNGQWVLVEPALIFTGYGEPDDEVGKSGDIFIQITDDDEVSPDPDPGPGGGGGGDQGGGQTDE